MSIEGIEEVLDEINHLARSLSQFDCEEVCPYGFILHPKAPKTINEKAIGLTVSAIVHGNEIGGLHAVVEWLRFLKQSRYCTEFRMGVFLGNYRAALQGIRFTEKDLNRSFASPQITTWEQQRAAEIAPILKQTAFHLDIHQTIEPTISPFFIFGYNPKSVDLVRTMDNRLPIITHWQGGFSNEGKCADEFTTLQGGVGITLELGQQGKSVDQVGIGIRAILSAVSATTLAMEGRFPQHLQQDHQVTAYTWAEIISWPEGDDTACLDPGWYNFKPVQAGERLGTCKAGVIKASQSGPVMFPKYVRKESGPVKPKEICRILRQVDLDQLGKN